MITGKNRMQAIPAADLRKINRAAILEYIHRAGVLTPAQIAADLALDAEDVSAMVAELIAENLAVADETEDHQPSVRFNGKDHLVLGIDLGGTKLYGAAASLDGEIIHELHIEQHHSHSEQSFTLLCEMIEQLLVFAAATGLPVKGIGIGVPGVVTAETGRVTLAPALHWDHFPLKAKLQAQFALPIAIENDANLAALGEWWFGTAEAVHSLLLLAIGTGIGAGVIVNGRIHTGFHHMAGEVGYYLFDRSCLGKRYPDFGALEQIASGTGIAARARQVLADKISAQALTQLTAVDVFDAARRQEPWTADLIAETVDALALLIGAITLVLDPQEIVVGGGVSRSAELLIEPIRARLLNTLPVLPDLRVSRLGTRAAALGAVAQVLQNGVSG